MRRLPYIPSITASALTLLLSVGCASPGPPPVLDVAGIYDGQLDMDGTVIPGTLEMRQEGIELQVTFSSPEIGISASGEGSVDNARVVLRLDYNLQCPGEARLDGTITSGGGEYSGFASAGDCTGEISGSFSFTRR